jgi:hypothetical protein
MMAEAGGRCPITNSARLSSSLVLNEVLLNLIKVLSIVLFFIKWNRRNEMKLRKLRKNVPHSITVTNRETAEMSHTINAHSGTAENPAPFPESPYENAQKQLLLLLYGK